MGLWFNIAPETCCLKNGQHNEKGIVDKISVPKPSGLGEQAEKPLESRAPYPQRGLGNSPCKEIECGAHCYKDRCFEQSPMLSHPEVLLRRSQPYPDHIRV